MPPGSRESWDKEVVTSHGSPLLTLNAENSAQRLEKSVGKRTIQDEKKIKGTIKLVSQLNWAQDKIALRMMVLSCIKHQIFLGTEYKPAQCGYSKIQQIRWQSSKQKQMMKKEVCGLQNMKEQIKQIK